MIVLDTHVWLWWLHDPAKLSSAAVELVEQEQESGALILSAISIWEVAVKVQSGSLYPWRYPGGMNWQEVIQQQ